MFTRRLGVTPSMQDLIQKLAAAQRPMSLNEYLNEHLPSDIHKKTPEDQTAIAKQLALRYETEKPKVDVVTQTTVSPAEQYIRERIKTKTEAADSSWDKPIGSQKQRGIESWGPPEDKRPPRTQSPGGSQGRRSFIDFPAPSRKPPQHESDEFMYSHGYVPQRSDPERRYLHKDEVVRGYRLHDYLKSTNFDTTENNPLLSDPYKIYDAARNANSEEDLQKIQAAFDKHKEERRKFIHTPTMEVADPDPKVKAWHDAKRLAELGIPVDAPTRKGEIPEGRTKPVTIVEQPRAELARMMMTNEHHAQEAIKAKQNELLLRQPDVMSLLDAQAMAAKARAEGERLATETGANALQTTLSGRDVVEKNLKETHAKELEHAKQTANDATQAAIKMREQVRDRQMGALLAQAGLPPNLADTIQTSDQGKDYFRFGGNGAKGFREGFGNQINAKGSPTLTDADIQALTSQSVPQRLIPPVLPKKEILPNVPSSDAPIFKEHLGVSQTMQPHEELLKAHANQGAVNKVQEALKDLRSFRDAHLNPTPAPVHTPPSSWGDRFWKGVEGIGDMIPGIHEGSNKYLRRAAGIALPIGVAGGTAYLANRFLNRNKEEPANNDEHQPEEDRPPQKKVASLAMFQGAYVR